LGRELQQHENVSVRHSIVYINMPFLLAVKGKNFATSV